MPSLLDELAQRHGAAASLIDEHECVSYVELAQRKNQYARWALRQGLAQGVVVALLMPNCPEYLAIWLGISQIGAVVALINTNLTGDALRHSIAVAGARHVIAGTDHVACLDEIRAELPAGTQCWLPAGQPSGKAGFADLSRAGYADGKLAATSTGRPRPATPRC